MTREQTHSHLSLYTCMNCQSRFIKPVNIIFAHFDVDWIVCCSYWFLSDIIQIQCMHQFNVSRNGKISYFAYIQEFCILIQSILLGMKISSVSFESNGHGENASYSVVHGEIWVVLEQQQCDDLSKYNHFKLNNSFF